MSIPVLVRSVGPEPAAGYYTNWTQFVDGYPKFKNQDTGAAQAFLAGDGVTLIAYRAHYLYFTGMTGEIIDRTVEFDVGIVNALGVGEYYDIPVTAYIPGDTEFSPDPGSSQNTAQPSGPARLDVVVTESFAVRTGDARVTPWMTPRFVQERAINGARWSNLGAIKETDYATIASVPLAADLTTELLGQDFGFNLPAGATVAGIEVEIARKVNGGAAEKSQTFIATNSDLNAITRSTDGYNFVVVQQTPYHNENFDAQYGNGVWIAANGSSGSPGQVRRSTDDGLTWAQISIPSVGGDNWTPVGVGYSNGVWLITMFSGVTASASALRSTDDGLTWAVVTVGSTGAIKSAPVGNGSGTWVIPAFSTPTVNFYRSTDNGATWTLIGASLSAPSGSITGQLIWTGIKFVFFGQVDQVANSADGLTWTTRDFGATAMGASRSAPIYTNGRLIYADTTNGNIFSSTDDGDTWSVAAFPAVGPQYSDVPGYAVYYDEVNGVYQWVGTFSDAWSVRFESPDFPPTTLRTSDYQSGFNAWMWYETHFAPAVANKYGLSFEATHLLAPVPVSGAIFDEGYAVPGGPFAYDAAELFEGRNSAGLDTWNIGRFGGDGFRGADAAVQEGTRTWSAAEINDPAFGVGYFARGQQGILEVAFVRARVYYRADPTTDTIPAKRSNGLAGVAESPSGVKVAVGVDGKILRKLANSPTWDAIASGTTISLNAVEWVGDRFIAVGVGGIALDGGVDGSAWTRTDTGAVSSLWAIRRVPDTLRAIAVGNDDYAFERSRLGVWSA